jgi:[protein-PII] uridylyltransferase
MDCKMPHTIDEALCKALSPEDLLTAPIIDGLKKCNEKIYADFDRGVSIEELVHQKSDLIDSVLRACCRHFIGEKINQQTSLVAVGGYGRRELLPGSDIDLMILLEKSPARLSKNNSLHFSLFSGI